MSSVTRSVGGPFQIANVGFLPEHEIGAECQIVGSSRHTEGGGVREAPPHVSYDMLYLSSSQEID